jgi:hypothetical protein
LERPQFRWLEDAENDLSELKVKNWKQMANNGDKLASVVK